MTRGQSKQSPTVPTKERNCTVCNSHDSSVVYEARLPAIQDDVAVLHYHYEQTAVKNLWHYRMVRCKTCGHIYANPIYEQQFVENSYLLQKHDNEFGIDEKLLFRTNQGYAALLADDLRSEDHRRLQLDVGCDTGIFIKATSSLAFRKVVGIEPGIDSANEARKIPGIEVMQKLFDPSDFERGSVDFLSLIHVLDHLAEPRRMLSEIKPLLAQDGLVLAVVHNIDSLIAKVSGENWPVINLVHFDYFTLKSLRRLFEAENYRVRAIRRTTNYFPLSHLIRFAPFLPTGLRSALIQLVTRTPLNRAVLGLRLGNIAVIATAS
jgi:SAM-dependent methyltransferase